MLSKPTIAGACMLFIGHVAIPAYGQTMEWRPVGSSGQSYCGGVDAATGTCVDNEILIPSGDVDVEFHLLISNWDLGTDEELGIYQTAIDAASYSGANAIPPNPKGTGEFLQDWTYQNAVPGCPYHSLSM